MTDSTTPVTAAADIPRLPKRLEESLAAKSALTKAVFQNWRAPDLDRGRNAIRMLSYTPKGKGKTVLDRLNEGDHKNADIFTSQRWAAKQAHEVFSILRQEPTLINAIGHHDRFHIALVGSSVSGLTFHAVLKTLIDLWKKGETPDAPRRSFSDLFQITYIDNHQRPMQRLLQARDRRIIPRFEFERIFKHDFEPPFAKIEPYTVENNQQELVIEWNRLERLTKEARDLIQDNIDALKKIPACLTSDNVQGGDALYMPAALCWQADGVREIAKAIEQGFYALVPDHPFEDLGNGGFEGPQSNAPKSTTGGPIFRDVETRDPRIQPTRRVHPYVVRYVGDKPAEVSEADAPQDGADQMSAPAITMVDLVLLADGPGVDISAKELPDGHADVTGGVIANSQDSFWNTPKADLDLVEGRPNSVLILGHSDSAAGAVFTTLLRDAQACSYRLLTTLLNEDDSAVRTWFAKLVHEVNEAANGVTASSETDKWIQALQTRPVLDVLYDTQAPGLGERNTQIRKRVRSSVDVAIALRPGDACRFRTKSKKIPPFMLFSEHPDAKSTGGKTDMAKNLEARLFDGAWPENKILMALLNRWFQLYQLDDTRTDPPKKLPLEEVMESSPPGVGTPHLHKSKIFKLVRTKHDDTTEKCYFKYVFDCRGPLHFSRNGNHHVPVPQAEDA